MSGTAQRILEARQLAARGDVAAAARVFDGLLSDEPRNGSVIVAVAAFEASQGGFSHAIARLQDATAAQPEVAPLWFYLGVLQNHIGDRAGATAAINCGLSLQPRGSAEALGLLASYALDERRYDDAFDFLARLLELQPDNAQAVNLLGAAHIGVGELESARVAFERSIALDPSVPYTLSNLASLATYDDGLSPPQVFAAHRRWSAHHATSGIRMPARLPRRIGRLRVGFLSTDFRAHSVSVFFRPLLEHLDRARAELTCYASVAKPDTTTARLRSLAERWVDVSRLDDLQAARQIWNDDIDLLIELGGHSAGNRLPVCVYRPARVQATWLGYPNTTGLSEIDFRLTDNAADPELPGDPAQSWHSEQLMRLDGPFFCYGGPDTEVTPLGPSSTEAELVPSNNAGHVTFGVATNIPKVRPAVIKVWCRLLRAVPGSRLQLVADGCKALRTREALTRLFQSEGVDSNRVDLLSALPFKTYLERHKCWDLVLDTFPANGHTTTCHALWMGCPLITLAGPMHASRLGASTLHFAGLDELVAHTPEEFVEIGCRLTSNPSRLREMRATLHEQFVSSPAMDGSAFARSFEHAVDRMTRTIKRREI